MKEIDFLPEWYESDRRRQMNLRRQYVALCGILLVMMVWSFVTTRSISKATAELNEDVGKISAVSSSSAELAIVQNQLIQLQEKMESVKKIDSKIDVASVLAEMSFLIHEKIVLGRVEFTAERFEGKQESKPKTRSMVRMGQPDSLGKTPPPLGDVRFKVMISGVAADPRDVAELICKLEDSPYFCMVYPSFSRNRKIDAVSKLAGKDYQVSEFEISCYLANYREKTTAENAGGG